MASLKQKVASGFIWKFAERIIAQGISFIITVVLARLLLPEEYGTISLVMVFIALANVFVSDGLGASLIQKKDADELDFSTMFFCSLFFGICLYFILFVSAPFIAQFYDNDELVPVIRVLSLQVPLASIKTIQHSYVSKHMMFRKFFFSTLGGTIFSGAVGIVMAYLGYGVWSLVFQYLCNSVVDMTVLFFTVKWRPHLQFSFTAAKGLLGYSWKLLFASLINTLYGQFRNLAIGKIYSEADLAYNTKGNQFPSLFIENINTSISAVLFPAMSEVGDNKTALKSMTRKSMQVSAYLIFPLMVGMIAVAEPLVRILLTEKWMGCVPFLRLACLYWMFQPSLTANQQAMKAAGRSDLCLKLEVIKKVFGFALIFGTMYISVYALAVSNVVFALISSVVNIFPNKKLIAYGFREQIMDLLPSLLLSIAMGAIVLCCTYIPLPTILVLIIQVIVGIVVYIIGSKLIRIESYAYVKDMAKTIVKKNK